MSGMRGINPRQMKQAMKKMGIRNSELKDVFEVSWIDKNLIGTDDPRRHGKLLTGEFAGIWRYRVGDFRMSAKIEDKRLVMLTLDVRNRRAAYR